MAKLSSAGPSASQNSTTSRLTRPSRLWDNYPGKGSRSALADPFAAELTAQKAPLLHRVAGDLRQSLEIQGVTAPKSREDDEEWWYDRGNCIKAA